jgi:predicted Rossmann fold nucleotide-binding protein DprA/Smf involved in DNA uptake
MTTVWIYVDTRYHPGHPDHLKVFANPVAADEWFKRTIRKARHSKYEVEVTAPTVHQMVLTLEKAGLITRVPGAARSIQLLVPPEALPILR